MSSTPEHPSPRSTSSRFAPLLGITAGLCILFALVFSLLPGLLSSSLGSSVFRAPPPFAIELVPSGEMLTKSSLSDNVTVLTFWAHWCRPCRQSLPHIDAVARHFAGDSSVSIIAVNIDWSDGPEPIATFLREAHITAVTLGKPVSTPSQPDILEAFGGAGIPHLVIIDRSGTIGYEHRGFVAVENLEAALIEKIGELRSSEEPAPLNNRSESITQGRSYRGKEGL